METEKRSSEEKSAPKKFETGAGTRQTITRPWNAMESDVTDCHVTFPSEADAAALF